MAETVKDLFGKLEPEEQSAGDLFGALEPETEHPWWSFAKREWGSEVEALKSTPENLAQSIEWGVRQFDPKNLAAFPSNLGDLWMWVARQMPEQQDFPETWAEASTAQKSLASAQVVSLAGLISILVGQGITGVNAVRTAYRMWRNTKNIKKAEELARKGLFERVEAVTGKKPTLTVETFKGKTRGFGGKIVERGGVERGRLPLADTKRVVESGWTAPKEPVGGPGLAETAKSITGIRARAAAEFAKNIPTATQTVGKNWMGDELERIGLKLVTDIAPKAQPSEIFETARRAITPLIKDLPAQVDVGAAETIANQFFQALIPMANQLVVGIEPTAVKPEKPPITETEEVTREEVIPEPLAEAPVGKDPGLMTEGEFVAEFEAIEKKVEVAEISKDVPLPKGLEPLGWEKDWETWSRTRGYPEEDIRDFKRWLELTGADKGFDYKDVSPEAIYAQHRPPEAPPGEVSEELTLAMKDNKTGEIVRAIEGEVIHTDMMARLGERYKDMEPGWVSAKDEWYDVFSGARTLVGFVPTVPPTPPPAGMPQEPEYDPLVKLTALIKQAKRLRPRVEEAYAKERGERFGQVEEYIDEQMDNVGGEEGFRAILGKMKGELVPPEAKAAFEPVKDKMTDEEFKNLLLRSLRHPYLTTGEKLSTADGLSALLMGQLPQPRQLVLLEEVYGSELVKELLKKRAWGPKAMETFIEVANVPRVLLATADMSGVLRQNIIPTVAHPVIAAKATAKAFQAAFKPEIAKQYFDNLRKADDYSFMKQMGISITDPTRATLVEREEAFISRFLSKIPVVNIPIGFAERGYTLLLTKTRVDLFRLWAKELRAQKLDIVKDVDVFRAAADVVNTFTGRGSLGKMGNRIAPQLNVLMFSPRLIAARFQALNPIWYAKQPKPVRKKAIADFAKFVAAGTTTLAMIKIMSEDDDNITVETDPRSSDFGKIRVGNTRYDIWGGFQQWTRVFAQIGTGERKVTTTGEIVSLNKEEYPFTTRKEVFLRFAEGKLAPTPALVNELMSGAKTFEGEDITLKSVAFEKFIPMYIQDIAEAYEEGGFERAFPAGVAAFMGIGVQTWEPRKKKPAKAYWFER